jgi:hypothetical protein
MPPLAMDSHRKDINGGRRTVSQSSVSISQLPAPVGSSWTTSTSVAGLEEQSHSPLLRTKPAGHHAGPDGKQKLVVVSEEAFVDFGWRT